MTNTKTNGPQAAPNDDSYRAHVEATFGRYDAVLRERDALSAQLSAALNTIKAATDSETLLRDEIASLRRQLEESTLRAIQAIAERAAYESLFVTFQATMRAFKVPAAPLIVAGDV